MNRNELADSVKEVIYSLGEVLGKTRDEVDADLEEGGPVVPASDDVAMEEAKASYKRSLNNVKINELFGFTGPGSAAMLTLTFTLGEFIGKSEEEVADEITSGPLPEVDEVGREVFKKMFGKKRYKKVFGKKKK